MFFTGFNHLLLLSAGGCDQRTKRGQEELPQSEVSGGCWEEQPHVQGAVAAWAQQGLEELFHFEGQEQRR